MIIFIVMGIQKFCKKITKDAILEHERLNKIDLFSTIKRNTFSDDPITVLVDVRSFSEHTDDILRDHRMVNNGIIGFTKTRINLSYSTRKII